MLGSGASPIGAHLGGQQIEKKLIDRHHRKEPHPAAAARKTFSFRRPISTLFDSLNEAGKLIIVAWSCYPRWGTVCVELKVKGSGLGDPLTAVQKLLLRAALDEPEHASGRHPTKEVVPVV